MVLMESFFKKFALSKAKSGCLTSDWKQLFFFLRSSMASIFEYSLHIIDGWMGC